MSTSTICATQKSKIVRLNIVRKFEVWDFCRVGGSGSEWLKVWFFKILA